MFGKLMIAAGTLAMLASSVAPAQAQSASERAYCEDYAYRTASRRGSGDDIGRGAVSGAVAGGVLGAILGRGKGRNIVKGAVAGTVVGGVLGATSSRGYVDRRAYRIAYSNCIEDNLDARPVRVYRGVSDDDLEYCASRYRSYNPRTGLYRTYSGQLRPCP